MLFDTDVLIWFLRGHARAAKVVDEAVDRAVSVVTCMELLQGARNKPEIKIIKSFLAEFALSGRSVDREHRPSGAGVHGRVRPEGRDVPGRRAHCRIGRREPFDVADRQPQTL